MLINETAEHLYCADSYNLPEAWRGITNPLDDTTLNGNIYVTGSKFIENNVQKQLAGNYLGAAMIVPIKVSNEVVGTVELIADNDDKKFVDADLDLLERFVLDLDVSQYSRKPCILYIVRHGESEANRDNLTCGHTDSPLSELGKAQAAEAKEALKSVHFQAVYSSDLKRAIETAEIIANTAVPVDHQLADLRERTFGHFEGQPHDIWLDIYKQFEDKYGELPFAERWQHRYAPGIESNGELIERFTRGLREIGGAHMGETVLVGTHAGGIRALLVQLGFAPESQLPPNSFANSAYTVIAYDGQEFFIQKVTGVKGLAS